MPERSVEEVLGLGNYVRIEEGLSDAVAQDEVRRCLRCDVCIGCGMCMAACSEMGVEALRMGDTGGRPARLLRLRAGRQAMHRLRRLHAGVPDRCDPAGGPGRGAAHDHHRHGGARAAAARLQRMRRADADARAPRVHPQAPAGAHGGASGPRDQPVLCAAAGRSSRDASSRPSVVRPPAAVRRSPSRSETSPTSSPAPRCRRPRTRATPRVFPPWRSRSAARRRRPGRRRTGTS